MYPPFSAFSKFVKQEARIARNPVISSKTLREEENKKEDVDRTLKGNKNFRRRNCFGTGANEVKHDTERNKKEDKPKRESCSFCKGSLLNDVCNEFTRLTLSDKMQFIRARGLCHGCLRWGHLRKDRVNEKTVPPAVVLIQPYYTMIPSLELSKTQAEQFLR